MPSKVDVPFQTLHEIVRAARINLPLGEWDYLVGGAESETTLKRNRRALDSLAFRPRVLRDVSGVDASTTFLGRKLRLPLMLAPIGSLESFAEGGGATAARAAGSFGIAQMLSSVCNPGLEAVAEATGPKGKGSGPKGKGGGSGGPGGNGTDHLRIFQLYVRGDAAWCDEWVRRAEEHGYSAFCLTVDTAAYSRRERDLAKRFVKAWRRDASGLEWQPRLNWDDVKRYKDTHGLPLILKGIATGEDAEIACQHGVDWVYVSNHGGRQLDHGRGGLEVLPEVVAAVNGRAKVLYDGAIMRGTDIVKAIASGADMVGIGRLGVIGLAAAGEAGLVRVLEILEDEVKIALALLGVRGFEELDASYLHPAQPVSEPHTLSAFPLLEPHEEGKGY